MTEIEKDPYIKEPKPEETIKENNKKYQEIGITSTQEEKDPYIEEAKPEETIKENNKEFGITKPTRKIDTYKVIKIE